MIYETTTKTVLIAPPGALVNNASVNTAAVDRHGFDYAVIRVILGSTDAALTALKLQESDDDATWSDVPGLDYSIGPATLPTAADSNMVFSFDVDLVGRKRYLKPLITVGAGTNGAYVAAIADLGRAGQAPKDAASRGLSGALAA